MATNRQKFFALLDEHNMDHELEYDAWDGRKLDRVIVDAPDGKSFALGTRLSCNIGLRGDDGVDWKHALERLEEEIECELCDVPFGESPSTTCEDCGRDTEGNVVYSNSAGNEKIVCDLCMNAHYDVNGFEQVESSESSDTHKPFLMACKQAKSRDAERGPCPACGESMQYGDESAEEAICDHCAAFDTKAQRAWYEELCKEIIDSSPRRRRDGLGGFAGYLLYVIAWNRVDMLNKWAVELEVEPCEVQRACAYMLERYHEHEAADALRNIVVPDMNAWNVLHHSGAVKSSEFDKYCSDNGLDRQRVETAVAYLRRCGRQADRPRSGEESFDTTPPTLVVFGDERTLREAFALQSITEAEARVAASIV